MADDKQNIGEPGRSRISVSEDYQLEYFAKAHGMTIIEVRDLIRRVGNDREKLEDAVKAMRRP